MLIDAAKPQAPRRSIIYSWKIAPAMDAPRLAPLKGARADPSSRREHRGRFPFAPPPPPVGAAAPSAAKGPKRVIEAGKRISKTHCVSGEVSFKWEHRSLRDGDVEGRLRRVDRGSDLAAVRVRCLRSPLMGAGSKRRGVRRSRTPRR
jgi:hypothetical protein